MKLHILKLDPKYYLDVDREHKRAELRKNDRDFQVGDLIHFEPPIEGTKYDWFWEDTYNVYQILHILKDVPEYGLDKDYVILSIVKITADYKI